MAARVRKAEDPVPMPSAPVRACSACACFVAEVSQPSFGECRFWPMPLRRPATHWCAQWRAKESAE